jgi:hypothetical protein
MGNNITCDVNSYCRVAAETSLVSRVSRCQLPLACRDCGFESHWGLGGWSRLSVVCCQVEISATAWSIVEKSPTECGLITNSSSSSSSCNNNNNNNNVLEQIETELTRLVEIYLRTRSTMTRIVISYKHSFSARVAQEVSLCTCERRVLLLLLHLQVNSVKPLVHIHSLWLPATLTCAVHDRCIETYWLPVHSCLLCMLYPDNDEWHCWKLIRK